MRKLTLDLDGLAVETFAAEPGTRAGGTVRAQEQQDTYWFTCSGSWVLSCDGTCDFTCGRDRTCGGTCDQATCAGFTCVNTCQGSCQGPCLSDPVNCPEPY